MNTTDNYIRRSEHDAIARDLAEFEKKGGRIETVPRGVSGMIDGLYGAVGRHIKKMKASAAKLYDDQPDSEETNDV